MDILLLRSGKGTTSKVPSSFNCGDTKCKEKKEMDIVMKDMYKFIKVLKNTKMLGSGEITPELVKYGPDK